MGLSGPIDLQKSELRIVCPIDPLVAETGGELMHERNARDDHPLEVQLRGDAKEQVLVQGVVMGHERIGGGSPVLRLQHRGVHLDASLSTQDVAHAIDHQGTFPDPREPLGLCNPREHSPAPGDVDTQTVMVLALL